jgi:uncharacterized membrane protein/YHS domain-containing protein
MRSSFLGCLGLLLLVGTALAAEPAKGEPQTPLNPYCPVMQGEKVDPDIYLDYQGKRIWFCCENCPDDFRADPEAYLGNLPQFAVAASGDEAGEPASGEEREEGGEHPLGALHPMFVHFPIALTMMALLAALLGLVCCRGFFGNARTYTIVTAALMAIPTFLLGDQAEEAKGRMSKSLADRVHEHGEWGEIALWVLLGVAAVEVLHRLWPNVNWLKWLSFAGIVGAAVVVGITGWHGAEVTHGAHHLDGVLRMLHLMK